AMVGCVGVTRSAMSNGEHCADLEGDRKLGERCEREFCKLGLGYGKLLTPHQIGRASSAACAYSRINRFLLPDVTVWTAPGEDHELKDKTATRTGFFGLEAYRLRALKNFADISKRHVYYTIHDHHGERDQACFRDEDWLTVDINTLCEAIKTK